MVAIDAFATIIGMPMMMINVITCMMTLALDGAGRASS